MADSVHQDVLELTRTRVAALTALGDIRTRILEVELFGVGAGDWEALAPAGPSFIILSGWGTVRPLLEIEDTCTVGRAWPFTIAPVFRTTKHWSVTDRNAQQAIVQKLLDSFDGTRACPLTLTYSGATCERVVFTGGLTSEGLVESFQQVMRRLTFEAWCTQLRT